MKDECYGPLADAIKHSVGEEHEQKLKDELTRLNIPFVDENVLRSQGYDKTPDVKLEVPVAVNGHVVNWIGSSQTKLSIYFLKHNKFINSTG